MKMHLKFSCEMCKKCPSCKDKYSVPNNLVCSDFVLDEDKEITCQKIINVDAEKEEFTATRRLANSSNLP